MLIQRLLLQHRPVVRPRCFVGQSSNGNGICALTQKEQLQIMSDFRCGVSNVLVATSIGEEGLDVGEVDLIVCFDICSSNPTRFVQRIGRTGRQRRGQVVMLVTEGREQQLLKDVLANRDITNRKLLQSQVVKRSLYEYAPRLVPPQFNPKCEQRFMEPAPPPAPTSTTPSPKSKARKPPKEPAVKCHDLRKFFKQSEDRFLQGEPTYEISEKSQQMLQKQMERHKVNVKSFLVDTQPTTSTTSITNTTSITSIPSTTSTTSTISNSQEETQRLRKLTRLLQSNKPLISDSQRSQDLVAQLQDKQLPHSLKLYLLKSNETFVREINEKMQQQVALKLPETRLNTRQQRTRRIYELVEELCNGQMEQLLQPVLSSAELTLKDLERRQPLDMKRRKDFEADCVDIFKDLHEQGLCADNHELVQQQLEQLELRRLEQTMKEQLGNETSCMYDQWADDVEAEEPTADASQWHECAHSSSPDHIKQQQPLNDSIIVDSSQLSANLSRLNCVISAASTPLNQKLQKLAKNSLLDALDENLSDFDQLFEQVESPKADITIMETEAMTTPDALDIDLNDFLEPLPEEKELLLQSGAKENQAPVNEMEMATATAIAESPPRNMSPDLFAEESMSPWRPTAVPAKSLAAKLAGKTTKAGPVLPSPERRPRGTSIGLEKSPSIFENYLQQMRGNGQLSRAAQRLHSMTSSISRAPVTATHNEEEDSPIVRRRPSKRKIYAISDEEETQEQEKNIVPNTQLLDDSFEQVPATQAVS